MSKYDVSDIKTLEGMEAIRLRPGMYIGSTGQEGVQHITLEIISNVIDEYLNGHCTKCIINVGDLDKNGFISIIDDGRGVPFGKAQDGTETLVNVYTKLHTGAKFDSSGKTGYNTSGGMNGVGAKATNALSEFFTVSSYRDGKMATASFKQGTLLSYKEEKCDKKLHGTSVKFKPDSSIFKETIKLDYNSLRRQVKELSYLSPNLNFEFTYEDKPTEKFCSKNGIKDYLEELNSEKQTLTSIFYTETMEDRIGVKIAMQYNDTYTDLYKLYTNSIPNSGGTHLTGFRTALTQAINKFAREQKILKDKDSNFTGEELKEGLVLILSFIMPDPVFSGQTKDVLSSSEARTMVQRLVSGEIEKWLNSNKKDAKAIVDKALLARAAREKAKKARETVRNTTQKNTRIVLPGKLADCSSTNRKECELFIVEGDSAAGSTKEARNRSNQAVFPIRGKIINCLKSDLNKVVNNDIINSMISAFGLIFDGKKIIVDEDKLRYGKIVITTDADVDGSHIRILFLTFIWKFAPELIEKGYIYAAVPPLYKVTQGTKIQYLKDDAALANFRKSNKRSFELGRMKGLGEMDPPEMAETVMNPNTRTLKQISVEDAEKVTEVFSKLMGESVLYRKKFIEENAWRANIDV